MNLRSSNIRGQSYRLMIAYIWQSFPVNPRALVQFFAALLLVSSQAFGATFQTSLDRDSVDVSQCAFFCKGQSKPATRELIFGVLGLAPQRDAWYAGDTDKPEQFAYRLAFKQPVKVPTLFVAGEFQKALTLKADSPYPGDVTKLEQWQELALPARQSGGRTITPDKPIETRAILLIDQRSYGHSLIRAIRIFSERLHNITPAALAYADREYYKPPAPFSHDYTYSAASLTTGEGVWESSGKNREGRIPTPPINDVTPSWFMLSWQEKQTVSGLWIEGNILSFEIDQYAGPESMHPRAGTEDEWKLLRDTKITDQQGKWIEFPPITTRGLRIRITKTADPLVAKINGIHTFTTLGDAPAPRIAIAGAAENEPPVKIPYQLDEDNLVTMVINGPDGTRVRNLFAREQKAKGPNVAGWDLRDEHGTSVQPGTYTWSAISYPRLQLKYEMTPYPNIAMNTPDNSPWLNGNNGPGGWMADHTAPTCVAVAGERVFLGSTVAESGVSLIECDLTGKKLWAHHSFAAWTGARYLAATSDTLFAACPILGSTVDGVWAIDLKTKEVREFLKAGPSSTRKRGMRGIAAYGDKLYISIDAAETPLATNAATPDEIDYPHCFPLYPKLRKERFSGEIVPDPQGDFAKLFRMVEPVAGGSSSALTYLESQKGSGRRRHIVLAFQKPIALGSLAFPLPEIKGTQFRISYMKPGAAFPPDMDNDAHWAVVPITSKLPWQVVALPEGIQTQALRLSFVKSTANLDDPLENLIESVDERDPSKKGLDASALKNEKPSADDKQRDEWLGQLEGMKLLRDRFAALSDGLTVRTSSGKINAAGEWDAQLTETLTGTHPAIYLMEYAQEQPVRGLAIKEVDARLVRIDIYKGPAGPIDMNAKEGWEEVAQYEQRRRQFYYPDVNNNIKARYLDGYVDFGREIKTRAVRLRMIEQWFDGASQNTWGVRVDRGGQTIDPKRCRVYGAIPVKYLGSAVAPDPMLTQRIEAYNAKTGKLESEFFAPHIGEIAFNTKGELFGIQEKKIVQIDTKTGACRDVVSDLEIPSDLAFDKTGNLFVADVGEKRHHIRVYGADGKLLRTIGVDGGLHVGPWIPQRMGNITSIDIDAQDHLWVVEDTYYPKRITQWTTAGELQRELLGNTQYGGGGKLDPEDKTRLVYGPLEFELDWNTGKTRLKNLLWQGSGPYGEIPMRRDGKLYFVSRPQFSTDHVAAVYLYDKDHLKRVAAVGMAIDFDPLKRAELVSELGHISLGEHRFMWSDRNGDGEVQANEVKVTPKGDVHDVTMFSSDFGVQSGQLRFEVKEFLPDGTPVYEEKKYEKLRGGILFRLADGNFYRIGSGDVTREGVLTPDGRELWTYQQEGEPIGQALHNAKPFTPDQVVAQLGFIGHELNPGHPLGEFVAMHTNSGQWNIWSHDGMLVGPVFRDEREPQARPWSMREHQRGMMLTDVNPSEEHFSGYICRANDNKYYVVAGHNHASVCEIVGFDKFKRFSGQITVSLEDVKKLQSWEAGKQKTDVYRRAPVLDCYRAPRTPVIDNNLNDWDAADSSLGKDVEFHMSYDDHRLFLACDVNNLGPFKNSGEQWDRLFKTGAALDLQIAADPNADGNRAAPAPGDLRLLLSMMKGKPVAVLYRAVVPGTPEDKVWRVVSPVNEARFDEVKIVDDLKMAVYSGGDRYIVEASVPLSALGLKPQPGLRTKMDWGLLVTGPDGTEVMRRMYWSNKATGIVADAPSEAILHPNLWGYVLFHGARQNLADQTGGDGLESPGKKKKKGEDIDELIDDLKTKK